MNIWTRRNGAGGIALRYAASTAPPTTDQPRARASGSRRSSAKMRWCRLVDLDDAAAERSALLSTHEGPAIYIVDDASAMRAPAAVLAGCAPAASAMSALARQVMVGDGLVYDETESGALSNVKAKGEVWPLPSPSKLGARASPAAYAQMPAPGSRCADQYLALRQPERHSGFFGCWAARNGCTGAHLIVVADGRRTWSTERPSGSCR